MFSGCNSLTNLNLSNFNTQNVTDMMRMFSGCNSLTKNNINTKDKRILNEYNNK
jgi:surface protein